MKYWLSSYRFNKLITKSKNTCKYIFVHIKKMLKLTINFYFSCDFFRDLVVCTPNKTHFYIIFK